MNVTNRVTDQVVGCKRRIKSAAYLKKSKRPVHNGTGLNEICLTSQVMRQSANNTWNLTMKLKRQSKDKKTAYKKKKRKF